MNPEKSLGEVVAGSGSALARDQLAELRNKIEALRKQIIILTAQRDTAYGYGSDLGKPPWMCNL